MSTQVILTSNVKGLGAEGDQVSVSDGFARNYLLPQMKAVEATAVAVKKIEALKLKRTERERKELEEAQELANKINKLSSSVELQTGENGKVFGSVTSMDIANALTSRGFQVEKRDILLEDPIKRVGSFEIPIRLHPQVTAIFKLTTTSPNMPVGTDEEKSEGSSDGKARAPRAKSKTSSKK